MKKENTILMLKIKQYFADNLDGEECFMIQSFDKNRNAGEKDALGRITATPYKKFYSEDDIPEIVITLTQRKTIKKDLREYAVIGQPGEFKLLCDKESFDNYAKFRALEFYKIKDSDMLNEIHDELLEKSFERFRIK